MSRKKALWIMLSVLLALTAVVIIVGFQVRNQQLEQTEAGSILIELQGRETVIPFSRLDRESFSRETTNGKGETSMHSYRGIEVITLLRECEVNTDQILGMTATAADQYSAEYTADELREPGKICLVISVDEEEVEGIEAGQPGVMVMAFGDSNSKRTVRNPVRLKVK